MNIPIIEHIRRDVLDTLGRVSVARGFQNTLTAEPLRTWGNTPEDKKCIVELGDEVDVSDTQGSVGRTYKTVDVYVTCYVAQAESTIDDIDIDARLNTVGADVEKALKLGTAGDDTSYSRNNYAVSTTLIRSARFHGGVGEDGGVALPFIAMQFEVLYCHAIDDPYNP